MDPSINIIKASDGSGNASLATVQSIRLPLATTIDVNTVSGIPPFFCGSMGTPHTFVDPVTSETITVISEATAVDFRGHVDGSDLEIDEIAPGYTDSGSAVGDIVIIRPTTQWSDNVAEVLAVSHNDDGTLKAVTESPGYTTLAYTPNTITNNGNRSYNMVFNGVDLTGAISPGMRLRNTRTVAAPTYMGGAFNGTNHYFTKTTCTSTLSTVTNNFTFMTFYEPTAYAVSQIGGRSDAASNNAMSLSMEADGRVSVSVFSGGVANYRQVSTYQSLPLNKKTHIAASWTGGTVVIYFDGISVPVATATTGGTAPTTAGTGGDFSIGRKGAYNANYAAGYISGFAVFDAVLTAATIKSYSSQVLSGAETNCIGAWSLNNTAVNQQAAGTNDLTATNSVGYTSGRSPYATDATGVAGGSYDYAIVTKTAFSTNTTLTVQVPEGCAIPTSGGVSAVAYSTQKVPFGFPAQRGRWAIKAFLNAQVTLGTTSNIYYADNVLRLEIPVGSWKADYLYRHSTSRGAASDYRVPKAILSTTAATETDVSWTSSMQSGVYTATDSQMTAEHQKHGYIDLTAQTIHYAGVSEGQTIAAQNIQAGSHINAECAYL